MDSSRPDLAKRSPTLLAILLTVWIPTAPAQDDAAVPESFPQESEEPTQESDDPFADVELEEAPAPGAGGEWTDVDQSSFLQPGQVKKLAEAARPSLVTIRQLGRDGESRGTGAGFIVDAEEGLVVTNLHVIGEGRPIEVELSDGAVLPAVAVHAWDRRYDLAAVRIEPGDRELKALSLGDSSAIEQGELIVGFGAPQGLEFSVVAGVVSAMRKLDPEFVGGGETPDSPMIQLAMPIEQGNSGGPILNLDGEVLGVVTLRHRLTENLGFAVPSDDLRSILAKPNPVLMSRWRTIGVLDPRQWNQVMGAEWTQRGGVITARRQGDGFGGRALCLSTREVPERPYEIEVKVRLDDESGAAGLAFASYGQQKHYGFYPSGGNIRLTRFEGPDVYSWTILKQIDTPAYEEGAWNTLRVRVGENEITGWVNDEKLFTIEEGALPSGRAGLCKFRDTVAEYRGFRIAPEIGPDRIPEEARERLGEQITRFLEVEDFEAAVNSLAAESEDGRQLLLEEAEELEARANQLRELEARVHRRAVINQLMMALDRPETEVDLFEMALQIARLDDTELDTNHYRATLNRLVRDADEFLEEHALEGDARERVEALSRFLFEENGFHGSRTEYYHHANSYVNHLLDDREGLPITLSVLFLEMARRLEIPGVFGAPVPGKFMVGLEYDDGDEDRLILVDVYERGEILTRGAAVRRMLATIGANPGRSAFHPATAREIAVRMLRNLVDIEMRHEQTPDGAEDYLEVLLAIEPDAARERFQRALLRIQDDNIAGARSDIDWLLEHRPPGIDYSRLEVFRSTLGSTESAGESAEEE